MAKRLSKVARAVQQHGQQVSIGIALRDEHQRILEQNQRLTRWLVFRTRQLVELMPVMQGIADTGLTGSNYAAHEALIGVICGAEAAVKAVEELAAERAEQLGKDPLYDL